MRPCRVWLLFVALTMAWAGAISGCGSDRSSSNAPMSAVAPSQGGDTNLAPSADVTSVPELAGMGVSPSEVDPESLLRAVVQLVQLAPTNPGGSHFDIAKDYLNQYFANSSEGDFQLSEATRQYFREHLGEAAEKAIKDLEVKTFTVKDARHIEDCLLLSTVARRVAGDGDDLTRVTRVFDWMVRQVQLVPAGSLAIPGGSQAQARPYDVLMRGMATEQGGWAERSWLFMALCRQLGLDAGLIVYEPAPSATKVEADAEAAEKTEAEAEKAEELFVWICAVLIDGKVYLFDSRIGLPVPGPGGKGVATLEQAASDPSILAQLDLPEKPYTTHAEDLNRGKLRIWLDSSLGHLAARMRQLQGKLAGRDRMVLFRDPAEQDAAFSKVLGDRLAETELWYLPMQVEYQLFNDPKFVAAAQFSIAIFDSKLPLLHARLGQLRGDLPRAVESYAGFRFSDNPVQNDGKTPIPPDVQDVLDLYATYYLGLAKLDQGDLGLAKNFFGQALRLFPKPDPGVPYYALYRWGAETNLGRINEELGNDAEAVRYYSAPQPTSQEFGNRLRARALIWDDPFPTSPADDEAEARRGAGATAAAR